MVDHRPAPPQSGRVPFYVVVAGNTGTGKSTLLRRLEASLRVSGIVVDVADERQFHHPLLGRMFREPRNWAFPIQVNFTLQRSVRLLASEARDAVATVLLMERSLSEDTLFFRYYLERGDIDSDQEMAYKSLHRSISSRAKPPDLVIHLVGHVDSICERLETAFARGERLDEHRGPQLREYVKAMNTLYEEWSTSARQGPGTYVRLDVDAPSMGKDEVLEMARAALTKAMT